MGADDNYRHFVPAHDLLQHFQPAHARHLEIKGDHLGLQFFNFFQAEVAIHRGADNLD